MDSLKVRIQQYTNTQEVNDSIWYEFNKNTDTIDYLKEHRNYIELNNLGYGDRGHHYMWYLIFDCLKNKNDINALEIGVYKGQVISLWALLLQKLTFKANIYGISPFKGNLSKNRIVNNKYISKLRYLFDLSYRRNVTKGNSYLREEYLKIIKDLFEYFNLDFGKLNLIKGLSNEQKIINQVNQIEFDVIYIDGDHSYNAVLQDIRTYSPLLKKGGFLVMDDASNLLPGTVFWKGRPEVAEACEIICDLGFENILNVGHNRVFKKI